MEDDTFHVLTSRKASYQLCHAKASSDIRIGLPNPQQWTGVSRTNANMELQLQLKALATFLEQRLTPLLTVASMASPY